MSYASLIHGFNLSGMPPLEMEVYMFTQTLRAAMVADFISMVLPQSA
jgi:hypothetical protein